MPARKPELKPVPHRAAVELAPDTPHRRRAIELAEAAMAGPMRVLQNQAELLAPVLQQFQRVMERELALPLPQPAPGEKPPRRNPFDVTVAQGLRAISRMQAVTRDMDRLAERCYQHGRETVYQESGVRVGPRFWPMEAADAGLCADTGRPLDHTPQQPPQESPRDLPQQPHAETQPAPASEAATNQALQDDATPLTSQYTKSVLNSMQRSGTSSRVLRQLRTEQKSKLLATRGDLWRREQELMMAEARGKQGGASNAAA